MISFVTYAVIALSVLLMVLSALYAWRDRLVDDVVLGIGVLVLIGLLVSLVAGIAHIGEIGKGEEKATFAAYLLSLPVIPVGTVFLAIKEKTRWAMVVVAVGAFSVAVMMVRCQQIWETARG